MWPILVGGDPAPDKDYFSSLYKHRFGGPLALKVNGAPPGQPALHRLVTLDLLDPKLPDLPKTRWLPLLYGFRYDGCRLTYRILSNSAIEIVELSPAASLADWPYADYPEAFPEVTAELGLERRGANEHLPNLTWQGLVVRPSSETSTL